MMWLSSGGWNGLAFEMTRVRQALVMTAVVVTALPASGCMGTTTLEESRHIPAKGGVIEPTGGGETLCPSAGWAADDSVLASVNDATLRLTRADGSWLSLSIDDGVLGGESDYHRLHHRGELVAATAAHIDTGGGMVMATSTILVAQRDGTELWRRTFEGAEVQVFGLAHDGRAVVHLYDYGSGLWPVGYALLGAEGEPHYLTDFQPRSEPDENGFIAGWLQDASGKRVGWWDTKTGELVEAQWAGQAPWFVVQNGQLLSIPAGGVAPWLMVESPGSSEPVESELVVLWDLPHDGELPELLSHHQDGWLLLRHPSDGSWWRVDTADGAGTLVEPAWPAGGELFTGGCDDGGPSVDSRGRVLAPWRDASAAQLQLIDADAGSAVDLGHPMLDIMAIETYETGGTIIASTTDPNSAFCPAPGWSEPTPADALSGPSIQLLRPEDDIHRVMPASLWAPHPTADGLCVLYADDGELAVLDVLRNEHRMLGHGQATRWLR